MRQRDVFEANCHAALTRYKEAIQQGTWHVTADNALVDAILKAADRYAYGATVTRRRAQIHAADLDAALARVMTNA